MGTKTYDPRKYDISFAGIPVNKGITKGTYLSITSESPGFSDKAGLYGEVVRERSFDRRATATITLMQTSEVNEQLSAHYESDRRATNGNGVAAFLVIDRNGTTVFAASKSWIMSDPDAELSDESSDREWEIRLADLIPLHGSTPDE